MKKLLIVPALLAWLAGCMPIGIIYTDAKLPRSVTDNEVGKKKGTSCAYSVLGVVAWGDASIRSAADAAGITEISAVDQDVMSILGIVYTKYCVQVSGKG